MASSILFPYQLSACMLLIFQHVSNAGLYRGAPLQECEVLNFGVPEGTVDGGDYCISMEPFEHRLTVLDEEEVSSMSQGGGRDWHVAINEVVNPVEKEFINERKSNMKEW